MTFPKWITGIILLTILVAGFLVSDGWSAPKPAIVPPAGTWQLDIEIHGGLKQIMVRLPGEDKPTRFWYLLYTVTNNTGRDVDFFPKIELMTDTFKLYRSDIQSRKPVFNAIKRLYANTIPLLEPESKITGKVLQGEDNARDSVAIFGDFDLKASKLNVFLAGLSNETVTVKYPEKDKNGKIIEKEVLLQKTLMLKYSISGDELNPQNRVALYRGREWIMR